MRAIVGALLLCSVAPGRAPACPFCVASGPTLAARRETARSVLLGELVDREGDSYRWLARHVVAGNVDVGRELTLALPAGMDPQAKSGSLWLLMQNDDAWSATAVTETSYGYFVNAPALSQPSEKRLRYFARYLEHADPQVAQDAYQEFARASYDEVAHVADALEMARLRGWLASDAVPDERKGLYGVALGLARAADERAENRRFLEERLARQLALRQSAVTGGDFRPGLDGELGGYLALAGAAGLDFLDRELLAHPDAAEGNLRHAVTALRFAHEYLRDIPPARVARSMRLLLARPSFAPAAIVDLARFGDWDARGQIVDLYSAEPTDERAALRRAIVGYLLTCGRPEAKADLEQLRKSDPAGVELAEEFHARFGVFGAAPPGR